MFPPLDLCYTEDPTHSLTTVGDELDDLSVDR